MASPRTIQSPEPGLYQWINNSILSVTLDHPKSIAVGKTNVLTDHVFKVGQEFVYSSLNTVA
jgi:hypothetical protein